MSLVLTVEGVETAAISTAVAIHSVRGRPFRAMVGAQVRRLKPRESLKTMIVDVRAEEGE